MRCLTNIPGPAEDQLEGNGACLDAMVLIGLVPYGMVSRLPGQRRARLEAPSMGTGNRRIALGRSMVVVTVERIRCDQEQTQIKILCSAKTFFTYEGSMRMVV